MIITRVSKTNANDPTMKSNKPNYILVWKEGQIGKHVLQIALATRSCSILRKVVSICKNIEENKGHYLKIVKKRLL